MTDISRTLADLQAYRQAHCRDAGDLEAADRLVLGMVEERLTFSTIDAADCGAPVGGMMKTTKARSMVRRILNRVLRQRARERAIAASGEEGTPAWSVDMHAVMWSALRHNGVNPALAALLDRNVGTWDALKRGAKGTGIRVGDANLIAGRVSIATLSGIAHPTDDAISFHQTPMSLQQCMTVRNMQIPDTLIAALPGRPVGDVVRHPALLGAEHVHIVEAHLSVDVLTLGLEDVRVTPAPPPHDADWLRFPWEERDPGTD